MPEDVVTMTKRIRGTAEVIVPAEDEEATWERVENAFGGWRDTEAAYEIEQVSEARPRRRNGRGPRAPEPGHARSRSLPAGHC